MLFVNVKNNRLGHERSECAQSELILLLGPFSITKTTETTVAYVSDRGKGQGDRNRECLAIRSLHGHEGNLHRSKGLSLKPRMEGEYSAPEHEYAA